jgi:hypothetical protein
MTPLEIQMLLHFYTTTAPWTAWYSAQESALCTFVAQELVTGNQDDGVCLTSRGKAYVEFLMAMPLPVMEWRLPSPRQEVMA